LFHRSSVMKLLLLASAMAGVLLSNTAPVHAQDASFQAEHFEPLPAQGINILNIGTSDILGNLVPTGGVFFHYANDPLVLTDPNNNDEVISKPLEHQLKAELWGGVGLFDIAEIGFVLPLVVFQQGDSLNAININNDVSSFAFADARIVPKIRLLDADKFKGFGIAVMAPLHIPVGDDQSFNSDGGIKFEPRLVADWRHNSGFKVALNAGYQLRPENTVQNIVTDDVVRVGAGVEIPAVVDNLSVVGSIFGNIQLEGDIESDTLGANYSSPFEALAGIQYGLPFNLVANLGGGAGITRGVGAPDFRVFGSIGYTPRLKDSDGDGINDKEDGCPEQPEDVDGFEDGDGCPDLDNDKDGIADTEDKCPDEAEDIDGFEDDNRCPDPDNDQDGIADVEDQCPDEAGVPEKQGCPLRDQDNDGILDEDDKCPTQPEDKDGYMDEDGCPDLDNDGDGIEDTADKCPLEPELKNGVEDEDGCPEADTDGDGIIDPVDKCPDKPETYNGVKDDDGCPDGKELVKLTETEVKIFQKVFFDSGKATIQKKSFKLLDTVVTVLKQNPQVTQIQIEGHTDDVGKDEDNLKLSKERAAAVRKYMADKGIAPERLVSEGFGEEKPLCEDMPELLENKRKNRRKIKDCRADNRRVEFKVTELNGKKIEASDSVKIKKEVPK